MSEGRSQVIFPRQRSKLLKTAMVLRLVKRQRQRNGKMPDFNALLDKDPASFERPPVAPEGEYLLVIKGKSYGQSSQKKTPFVEFQYGVVDAMASVPEEALDGIDLAKIKLRDQFYLTEDAMFRLREFFETVGCLQETTRESIDAAVGQQVVATIGHETSDKDPTRIYANIRGYVKAE